MGSWNLLASAAASKDPFQEYEYQEIMVEIKDLMVEYKSYDEDNINNVNSAEIVAALGSLNLIYIEKYQAKNKKQGVYD